ncbi:MAG: hypothetical protein ACK2UO_20005 [Caldilineaceae bacterium]|jgi:hypothetical protein
MGFEMLCATIIALAFGTLVCFAGYRLFLVLLPIWGFFVGFALGAQTIQAILGDAFLGTVTSWVVGFVVAVIFAVLSYLFYIFAVIMIAAGLGYGLGVGLMTTFMNMGIIPWLVGIVVAIILVVVTLMFNLQKYVIIAATALAGALLAIGTLMLGAQGLATVELTDAPIKAMLNAGPIWAILFLVMAIGGIVVQIASTRTYYLETYENRI